MMRTTIWLVAAAIAAPAMATTPCPSTPAAAPPDLAAWAQRAPLPAGPKAELPIGRAVDLRLAPAAGVRLAATPGKPADPALQAGLAQFTVTRTGTYRIALGAPAWVDVVAAGKPIASTTHGHGPACTGIRKIVDFALTPGRYTLQLTSSPVETVGVLIVAK